MAESGQQTLTGLLEHRLFHVHIIDTDELPVGLLQEGADSPDGGCRQGEMLVGQAAGHCSAAV